jgi:predicted nucleic acid-binding protein
VIVVPDAGPLIYLAGAGHLELLQALYSQVVVAAAAEPDR